MKGIMFNDRFHLTTAVIEGNKTMTRRECTLSLTEKKTMKDVQIDNLYLEDGIWMFLLYNKSYPLPRTNYPKYSVGETIAILQSYEDIYFSGLATENMINETIESPGQRNKMYVKSEYMPYGIKITNIRAERLQDISDEDCIAEGVKKASVGYYIRENGICKLFPTPHAAFAALIDKICGKGTWNRNGWQWVYEFELIKK